MLLAAKGQGYCPDPLSAERTKYRACIDQDCSLDEVCMDRIDLLIALDASGSITEEGFDVIKEFAVRLVKRIHAEAYDQDKVRLGAIMFGKGKLDEDRVVSDAVVADGMGSEDFEVVAKGINALKWQRGFTNMAQAFTKAKTLFTTNARRTAESVLMMITDGRPSFKFQTGHAARVMIVHVMQYRKQDNIDLLMDYASQPAATNYLHTLM